MKPAFIIALSTLVIGTVLPPVDVADLDEDGIADDLEQLLIDMYRPTLHYDTDETVRPCSVTTFVTNSQFIWRIGNTDPSGDRILFTESQLEADPLLILRAEESDLINEEPSTTTRQPFDVGYRIDVADGFRNGPPPPADDVGMYAHVVPLAGPIDYTNGPVIPPPPLSHNDFYLLQYWQFLPFNDFPAPVGSFGDHEGDWLAVDLFVDRACPYKLRYVVHHHHGDDHCDPTVLGEGFDSLPAFIRAHPLECDPDNFVKVPQCYLEAGAHEWWPHPSNGGECSFFGFDNPSHGGFGGTVFVQEVMNLGERYAPMPGLEPQLVLFFNGKWGHDHGDPNGPSVGPLRQHPPGYPFAPLMVAYVDAAAAPWDLEGLGSRFHPFPTIADAVDGPNRVETGGRVRIAPRNYPGGYRFSRPMRFERDGPSAIATLGR